MSENNENKNLKHTGLYKSYKAQSDKGITFTEFGSWELPLDFGEGIIAEHNYVRRKMGMFDVSHMGECMISGPAARDFLDMMITNNLSDLQEERAMYTVMCYENGTCVDDLIVYRLRAEKEEGYRFFVVMNASNTEKDLKHFKDYAEQFLSRNGECTQGNGLIIEDLSDRYLQIALQGPESVDFIKKHFPFYSLEDSFSCCEKGGMIIGRTGYTGEKGYEFYIKGVEEASDFWNQLCESGVKQCGLGCRDTLRLEAKLPLYGHEISSSISPLEANLNSFVKLDKSSEFIGKNALIKQKNDGVPRSLRGFRLKNGVPRSLYRVFFNGNDIGYVTSGAFSPVLNEFICLCLIDRSTHLKFGDIVQIDIHGKMKDAELVKTPFVQHG